MLKTQILLPGRNKFFLKSALKHFFFHHLVRLEETLFFQHHYVVLPVISKEISLCLLDVFN